MKGPNEEKGRKKNNLYLVTVHLCTFVQYSCMIVKIQLLFSRTSFLEHENDVSHFLKRLSTCFEKIDLTHCNMTFLTNCFLLNFHVATIHHTP